MKTKSLTVYVPYKNKSFLFFNERKYNKVNDLVNDANATNKRYNAKSIEDKLRFSREFGCSELIINCEGEAILNKDYLNAIFEANLKIENPFDFISFKTTGKNIGESDLLYLKSFGVKEICLMLASKDTFQNSQILKDIKTENRIEIDSITEKIKNNGFILRVQFYLTRWFDFTNVADLQNFNETIKAEKVTFKVINETSSKDVNEYIKLNAATRGIDRLIEEIENLQVIGETNKNLKIHSLNDTLSIVYDNTPLDYKTDNLFFYPNIHLYTMKDNLSSLIY